MAPDTSCWRRPCRAVRWTAFASTPPRRAGCADAVFVAGTRSQLPGDENLGEDEEGDEDADEDEDEEAGEDEETEDGDTDQDADERRPGRRRR